MFPSQLRIQFKDRVFKLNEGYLSKSNINNTIEFARIDPEFASLMSTLATLVDWIIVRVGNGTWIQSTKEFLEWIRIYSSIMPLWNSFWIYAYLKLHLLNISMVIFDELKLNSNNDPPLTSFSSSRTLNLMFKNSSKRTIRICVLSYYRYLQGLCYMKLYVNCM